MTPGGKTQPQLSPPQPPTQQQKQHQKPAQQQQHQQQQPQPAQRTQQQRHLHERFRTEKNTGASSRRVTDFGVPLDKTFLKKEVSSWAFLTWLVTKTQDNVNNFSVTCGLCLATPTDPSDVSKLRRSGYLRLSRIIHRYTRSEIQVLDARLLVWSCLNLVAYYQERVRRARGCNYIVCRSRLLGSRDIFSRIIDLEVPEREKEMVRACINFFTRTWHWDDEEIVLYVFQELLSTIRQEFVVSKLIKAAEVLQRQSEIDQAQMMATSLSLILENLTWERTQFTPLLHMCFNTMLKIYLLNDFHASRSVQFKAASITFRAQIKNCIRHFINSVKDDKGLVHIMDSVSALMLDPEIPDEEQADLLEIISFCAQKIHVGLYRDSLTPNILNFLFGYLKSDYRSTAMCSQKILHYLLDRRGNLQYFIEPIYHFKGRSSFVVNAEYARDDARFIRGISDEFFGGLYKCLKRYTETTNLMSSYTTACLLLVEVPDPVTTISMIRVLIRTQNNVLRNDKDYTLTIKSHIHAVVASILSLICLVHADEVAALGKYVQEVVGYRNENSPHLLPPLSPQYNIAKHHTTDYHKHLYFLEEEVLCALKQCWLGRRRSN